jgi:hypothetical protein
VSRLATLWKHQQQIVVVFSFGVVLSALGAVLALTSHPNWATFLAGIGCSLIAASIVTFLSPVTEEVYHAFLGLGISAVHPSRRDVANRQWVGWLKSSRRYFTVVGIANEKWCEDEDFPAALEDRLRNEVEVKIFFLDPNCDAARTRAKEDAVRDTLQAIRRSITFMWNYRSRLDESIKERLTLRVYTATPSLGVTWFDTSMIVTHYVAGSANVTSPALMVRPSFRAKEEGALVP